MKDVLQNVPRDRLIRYSFVQDNQLVMLNEWNGFQNIIDAHPPESPLDLFKVKGRWLFTWLLSFVLYFFNRLIACSRATKRIQSIVIKSKIERVLVVLNSPFMINLASELIKKGHSVYAIVWDPPESLITGLFLPKIIARFLLMDFRSVIKNSVMLGTASYGMRSEYCAKYNKDSVVLIHSLPVNLFEKPKKALVSMKGLSIGFAGNLYATKEWEALIKALNTVDWSIADHKVKIEVLGNGLTIYQTNPNMQITFWGWRDLKETIRLMSKVDIGYLPYWSDDNHTPITTLTFPNKISVYLAAGIPILYHGHSLGSPAQFLSKYPVGLGCYSLDPNEIIKNLEAFVLNRNFFIESAKFIQKARLDEFNLDKFQFQFNKFMQLI